MNRTLSMSDTNALPAAFTDLEPFLATWGGLETQQERYLVRQQSSMKDLRRFYDALAPRIEAVLDHLDRFPMDAPLPPAEEALFRLALGLTEASLAIEVYGEPGVPFVPTPHVVSTVWSDGTG
jgi:hypothetical protein